jgi:hypothetical protein
MSAEVKLAKIVESRDLFLVHRVLFKLKYTGKEITFQNALETADEQCEIHPPRLAAMTIAVSRN